MATSAFERQLQGYGLEAGCNADFVLLQAHSPAEAIRLRATRLAVVRRGAVVSRTPAATATLSLPGRPAQIDWTLDRATSPDTAT
jgi:cytosine deaminase